MIDQKRISRQVMNNCNISDATNAGLFSICGLALRLRDLYKWENKLNPWDERDSAEVLDWIGQKEEMWEAMAQDAFTRLTVNGRTYDPFDSSGINAVLAPFQLYYGAGYGRSLKPTFFLGVVEEKQEIDGISLLVTGRELARDLLTIPASSQDRHILLRREAGSLYLWDQMQYINKSGRGALTFALNNCGIRDHRPENLKRQFSNIYHIHKDLYIYHELGEMQDNTFPRHKWREIISEFPHTTVELAARAVKDLLADTGERGTLPRIIRERSRARLGFYVAFMTGIAKALFPELPVAFADFIRSKKWNAIEQATGAGRRRAKKNAHRLITLFEQGKQEKDPQWTEAAVEKEILNIDA